MRKYIYVIIEPNNGENRSSILYDRIMMLIIILSIIPLMFRIQNVIFDTIEYVATIIFILDYILHCVTADYKLKKNKISFILYPFTFVAIIDLLSILPIVGFFNNSLRLLRTWRLLRILRIAKIFKYYEPLQIVIDVFKKNTPVLLTVVGFALFYIYITALIMFNVDQQVDPKTGMPFFGDFFDAIYWSTCTLTTVGYGDIYPTTSIGRIVSMISSIVGIAIIALPSGIITAGYLEEVNERRKHNRSVTKKL